MGFVKGTDGIASTLRNTLEGSVGNIALENISAVTLTSTANVTGGNLITAGQISAGGNVTSGNVSVTGNVTGNYILGNGSQLTGIAASYGNSNVATFLAAYGSNTVSTTGNITSGNILTGGIVSATGNVQAGNISTAGQVSATGNITTAGNFVGNGAALTNVTVSVAGNIVGTQSNVTLVAGAYSTVFDNTGNTAFANGSVSLTTLSASGNITGGNIRTGGLISATGNVTGNYILGNGSQLTGIVSSYGNANVVANLAALGSNPVSTTGNVTGGNVLTSGVISSTGNITGGNISATNHTGTTVSVTGNITAANFFGNGNTLSNVATRFESAWTVPVGNSTQSFTVGLNETYYLWVDCNIPNGILAWNATATVTNTNVPVVGAQYAWVYNGGGTPIDFTSIPNQFVGTSNTIVRSSVAPSATTNRFDFGLNNTSGGNVTVRYGWVAIS